MLFDIDDAEYEELARDLYCCQAYFEIDVLDKLRDVADEVGRVWQEVHFLVTRSKHNIKLGFDSLSRLCPFLPVFVFVRESLYQLVFQEREKQTVAEPRILWLWFGLL